MTDGPRSRFDSSNPGVRAFLAGALLVVLCMAAYAPVLPGKFVWDDAYLVGANPLFKSPRFIFEVFRHYLFVDSISVYYRPVQNLTYILDYALWNRDEFGYHLSNVLYHAAAAILLWLMLRRCLRRIAPQGCAEGAAYSVALLWAVHPIHNAAVAYIAGRADSLAMIFALAGWLLLTMEPRASRSAIAATAATIAGALCMLLAICSKEIGAIWLALLLVWLFGFDRARPPGESSRTPEPRRPLLARLGTAALLLAVFILYLGLRHLPAHRNPPPPAEAQALAARLLLMVRALGQYTALLFWPANLHMERTLPPGPLMFILGLVTAAGAAFACFSRLPGRAMRILGVIWFVIGFLPISNLFPLNAEVAEHWIYMASAGYLLTLAGFAVALPLHRQGARRALLIAVPVLAIALTLRTASRAAEWADPETFYKQTIASGGNPERVILTLANLYADRGDLKGAEALFRETLRRYPGYPVAQMDLARILVAEGRPLATEPSAVQPTAVQPTAVQPTAVQPTAVQPTAVQPTAIQPTAVQPTAVQPSTVQPSTIQPTTAVSPADTEARIAADTRLAAYVPDTWNAALNLAHSQYNSHQPAAALATLDSAIARNPGVWDLIYFRAQILWLTRDASAALPAVRDFAATHWWHYDSQRFLGQLLVASGDYPAGLAALRNAATLDIHASAPFDDMARYALRAGHPDDALAFQRAALTRAPDSPHEYQLLAALLQQLNRPAEATAALQQAAALTAPDPLPPEPSPTP